MCKNLIGFCAALALSTSIAKANDNHVAPITEKIPEIRQAIVNDLTISVIKAKNAERTDFTQAKIDKLEEKWQSELDSGSHDLINTVVKTDLGEHLRKVIKDSNGLILELNVMDAHGLSVGQSGPNSDIWQGEEAKYQKTFLVGPKAVFVDEVEEDGSTQQFLSQANFTIADPETGKAIGAVSVGIDVEVAMEKKH